MEKVAGYAASAKSTTALNFCKIIHNTFIDYIVDNTKEKIRKIYSWNSHTNSVH
jgi:hypothetical protein